jgi:glycosyltransferase involved in cell wall biosynthesis
MLKDIFPQNALDLGILTKTGWKGWITKYFFVQEKKLYLLSDMLGCMSEANVKFIKEKHPYLDESRIEVCPNTINPSIPMQQDIRTLREKFKLPMDKMVFVCGGNFGRPQDVTFMIAVLKGNTDKFDRHFVLCGSGTDFHRIKEYKNRNSCSPITVIEGLKQEEFNQLLDACDIGLIFLDHRFTIPNFPSRVLDYMNHYLPVLAATDRSTDIGKVILNGNFGWWCVSKNVNKYNRVIDEICANPKQLEEKRRNSRTYLINHYDTKVAYERIMNTYRNLSRK